MKLRFVKFLTSRENEIEKKEEEAIITYFATTQLGRVQSHLSCSRPPPSIISPSPSTHPHQSASSAAPASPPPRAGRAIFSSYPLPSCSASPFLLHKLPKRKRAAAVVSSQPTQLSYPTIACGRPARRTLAPPGGPLVLHRFRFLLSLGAVHPHRAKPQENKDRK